MLQLGKPEEWFWITILSLTGKEAQSETLQSLLMGGRYRILSLFLLSILIASWLSGFSQYHYYLYDYLIQYRIYVHK